MRTVVFPLGRSALRRRPGSASASGEGNTGEPGAMLWSKPGSSPTGPTKRSREKLLESLVGLVRQHRRFPAYSDIRMAKQADPTFPTHHAFNKLGDLQTRIAFVRAYVTERGHLDVLDLLPAPEDGVEATTG